MRARVSRSLRPVALAAAPLLGALLLAGLLAAACGGGDGVGGSDGRLRVVATTAVIGSIADELGDGRIDLTVLIPAGADPHDFQLTTGARRAVENADVILRHGLGLDQFLDSVTRPGQSGVWTVSAGARLREVGGETDPHIWLDADNARIMVDNVAEALAVADPSGSETYRSAAAAYAGRLEAADGMARQAVSAIPTQDRLVVSNHDSLGYLLDRYEIVQVGSVIPGLSTAAEPSARDVADLLDLIRTRGVRVILAEGSVDPKIARQIAADTGALIVDDLFGDTLGDFGTSTGTLDGVIRHNMQRIVAALAAD